MKATLLRLMIASSLLARVAFSAPESPAPAPADDSSAPPPAHSSHAARHRTVDDSAQAKSVINGPVLSLYHGEVQVLDLADVTRIAVGNGDVLRANVVASNQVVLIGQNAGSTSLRVWTRSGAQFTYEATVRSFDVSQILRDAQDLLAGEPGISARQVDGHVLIEGDYKSAKTASRIEALMKIYPQIVSTVPLRQAEAVVTPDRMVYMDVRVVEILKSTLRRLGVNWQGASTGGATVGLNLGSKVLQHIPTAAATGGLFGIAANLTSSLDVLEQAGESWTLAEPTVSCKSGGSAKFTVGGEIPVPVSAGLGTTTVIYKDYGVILEFKPVADAQGNVSSSIVAEVSQPDSSLSNATTGLIAFLKTRTETDVSLKVNETLVISGLLKNSGSQAANGIPGAKDIPVLGNLFKSKQFQNDRTELVVMVTPRSVEVRHASADAPPDFNATSIHEADEMQAHVAPTIKMINSKLAE